MEKNGKNGKKWKRWSAMNKLSGQFSPSLAGQSRDCKTSGNWPKWTDKWNLYCRGLQSGEKRAGRSWPGPSRRTAAAPTGAWASRQSAPVWSCPRPCPRTTAATRWSTATSDCDTAGTGAAECTGWGDWTSPDGAAPFPRRRWTYSSGPGCSCRPGKGHVNVWARLASPAQRWQYCCPRGLDILDWGRRRGPALRWKIWRCWRDWGSLVWSGQRSSLRRWTKINQSNNHSITHSLNQSINQSMEVWLDESYLLIVLTCSRLPLKSRWRRPIIPLKWVPSLWRYAILLFGRYSSSNPFRESSGISYKKQVIICAARTAIDWLIDWSIDD